MLKHRHRILAYFEMADLKNRLLEQLSGGETRSLLYRRNLSDYILHE